MCNHDCTKYGESWQKVLKDLIDDNYSVKIRYNWNGEIRDAEITSSKEYNQWSVYDFGRIECIVSISKNRVVGMGDPSKIVDLDELKYSLAIDYQLAQALKEAGFPQSTTNVFYPCKHKVSDCDCKKFDWKDAVYIPTLEELIEACGDDFFVLAKCIYTNGNKYKADGRSNIPYPPEGLGKTAEEAVARLWLALNKE